MNEAPGDLKQPSYVIIVGGDVEHRALLPVDRDPATVVIAADSGLDVAHACDAVVHHVVGDLDSATPEALDAARRAGATIHRHPADKDATDFELALDLMLGLASDRRGDRTDTLLVLGPGGGRQDMVLADLLALAGPRLAAVEVTARYGEADWLVVRPERTRRFVAAPQEQVSLLPIHGGARGVTTAGLRWPLVDADLVAGTTRGLSNAAVGGHVSVSITSGVLLVCRPGRVVAPVEPRPTPYDPSPRNLDPRSTQGRLTAKYRS